MISTSKQHAKQQSAGHNSKVIKVFSSNSYLFSKFQKIHLDDQFIPLIVCIVKSPIVNSQVISVFHLSFDICFKGVHSAENFYN